MHTYFCYLFHLRQYEIVKAPKSTMKNPMVNYFWCASASSKNFFKFFYQVCVCVSECVCLTQFVKLAQKFINIRHKNYFGVCVSVSNT